MDRRRHLVELVFECEMPSIENMHFRIGQIAEEEMRAFIPIRN